MGYLVVTDQPDLEAVANSVLKARISKAARASALDVIRAANPGLDLTRLKPGAVVRIPPIDGTKLTAPIDGHEASMDDLLGAANDALARLSADTIAANQANDDERNGTRRLLESGSIADLAGRIPALKQNIESVLKTLEEDSNEERERVKDLIDEVEGWTRQLEKLRAL